MAEITQDEFLNLLKSIAVNQARGLVIHERIADALESLVALGAVIAGDEDDEEEREESTKRDPNESLG